MSVTDFDKDETGKRTLAHLTKDMHFHLCKLMEMSGKLESLGASSTALTMRNHIVSIDDIFSQVTDRKHDPNIQRQI